MPSNNKVINVQIKYIFSTVFILKLCILLLIELIIKGLMVIVLKYLLKSLNANYR